MLKRVQRYSLRIVLVSIVGVVLHNGWSLWDQRTSLDPERGLTGPELWAHRAQRVRDAFLHAYDAYEAVAFPHDELKPLTNSWIDNYNGWGLTAVDALDTMILMNLTSHAERAKAHARTLSFDDDSAVPFFETTIRYLGGLLSSYALTGEKSLLQQADALGSRLLQAFKTPSGLPAPYVNMKTGEIAHVGQHLLAEIGSCQLEFRALSYFTGNPVYAHAVDKVTKHLAATNPIAGLYATKFSRHEGEPINDHHSVGSMADSAYEYLLKGYLQTNSSEPDLGRVYMNSAAGIIDNLMLLSAERKLAFVTDSSRGQLSGVFEHLTCFLPGVLTLGTKLLDDSFFTLWSTRDKHEAAAAALAEACYTLYVDSPNGLCPDEVKFAIPSRKKQTKKPAPSSWSEAYVKWHVGDDRTIPSPGRDPVSWSEGSKGAEYNVRKSGHHLRPEAIESLYVLWRTTGDVAWREKGWKIFDAIDVHARVKHGFAGIQDAHADSVVHADEMPSWFLAETLKYAYLLCVDENPFPMDQWVFNTEAHPLPIFPSL